MTKITKDEYVHYVIRIFHAALHYTYKYNNKLEITKDLIEDPEGIIEQLFIQNEYPELM